MLAETGDAGIVREDEGRAILSGGIAKDREDFGGGEGEGSNKDWASSGSESNEV